MKFAILGHLLNESHLKIIPKSWIQNNMIVSPEFDLIETKGHILGILMNAKEMMNSSREIVRKKIFDIALFAQEELSVEIMQLGALTTSVTNGGKWLVKQNEYKGFVTHGDSYTAAVTCQTVEKALNILNKKPNDQVISIVGAYGIIGEAVSKILVPKFKNSILIGRRSDKLKELEKKVNGNYKTTTDLETRDADIIVTATSHPTALLNSEHLKENAIIVDVSQPPNLNIEICKKRPDIIRIDGGFVNHPEKYRFFIPEMPEGKCFSCMAEVIMQAMENERNNYIGSINLEHLYKTVSWGKKYKFILKDLTNFGKPI